MPMLGIGLRFYFVHFHPNLLLLLNFTMHYNVEVTNDPFSVSLSWKWKFEELVFDWMLKCSLTGKWHAYFQIKPTHSYSTFNGYCHISVQRSCYRKKHKQTKNLSSKIFSYSVLPSKSTFSLNCVQICFWIET